MTPHVRLEGIAASMWQALPVASPPLTRILLLPVLNVRVVDMLDQFVHIALVAGWATIPVADGHLVLKILFVKTGVHWRTGDVA